MDSIKNLLGVAYRTNIVIKIASNWLDFNLRPNRCDLCRCNYCTPLGQVHTKLNNTHLALMHYSWAMDLDPKVSQPTCHAWASP